MNFRGIYESSGRCDVDIETDRTRLNHRKDAKDVLTNQYIKQFICHTYYPTSIAYHYENIYIPYLYRKRKE